MRKTLSVAVLLLALCCPAFAGVIHTPPAPQPPPPSNSDTNEPSATSDEPAEAEDSLTQIVLDMLRVLPSLL
jgi:hypothetical protein